MSARRGQEQGWGVSWKGRAEHCRQRCGWVHLTSERQGNCRPGLACPAEHWPAGQGVLQEAAAATCGLLNSQGELQSFLPKLTMSAESPMYQRPH